MAEYKIRFAETIDIPNIMQFIDTYWKKNHILATDKGLFEWQYINKNNKVNMVVGLDEKDELQAILGYIPYSDGAQKDISLALWKAKPGTAFLGVKLLMFLLNEEPHRHVFCNGINVRTSAGIYHRLGIKTDKLSQWYRLRAVDEFKIAEVTSNWIPQTEIHSDYQLIKIEDFVDLENSSTERMFDTSAIPYKSKEYVNKRYFKHPAYKYIVYYIKNHGTNADAAVVFRIQSCNTSTALRLIDFIGDNDILYKITPQIDLIADENHVEYVDMYEHGLDAEMLRKSGWRKVGDDDNIIPNYFAPYEKCNVDINISTSDETIVLFKGDGDQDRPN